MSTFAETVKQDTPRMVVLYRRDERGQDQFRWGLVGQIPVTSLIGYIVRVQSELMFRDPNRCGEEALVIVWDDEYKKFSWFVHPNIPVDPLIGMLETIKAQLVDTQMAHMQMQQQTGLIAPDGKPILKKGRQ